MEIHPLGLGPSTIVPRPLADWVPGYAKTIETTINLDVQVTGLGHIYDDFNTVDDWINVHGRLRVTGGTTSDVYGPALGYAAGRHKMQLLTDNCRAKVIIQDGVMAYGESRVWICGDAKMNRYYGMAINFSNLATQVSIIRGRSSISVDKYETTAITLLSGDAMEVWYDRINSMVRVYQNGSEVASKRFAINDIPHGRDCRWTGVVMGCHWLIDVGPNFTSFEAWDVMATPPAIHDPVDSTTVNPHWNVLLNSLRVNRHIGFRPMTLAPTVLTAAAVWDTELATDSVKAVITVNRFGIGDLTLAVCSNATMTNWMGVKFDSGAEQIIIVTGTGRVTMTARATTDHIIRIPVLPFGWLPGWKWVIHTHFEPVRTGQQYTIQYDYPTNKISVYRGSNLNEPLLEWVDSTNIVSHGVGHRYVGMSWNMGSLPEGIQPSAIDVYNVTPDTPLP